MAGRPICETNVERARAAWGEELPRWIEILAAACDRTTQRRVADSLSRSSGYVSRLINRNYTGSWPEAEQLVLSTFSADTVECPVARQIALKVCIRFRRRKGTVINMVQRQFASACPTCPNNTDIGGDDA